MGSQTLRQDSVAVGLTAVEVLRERYSGDSRISFYIRNNSIGGQKITLVFGDYQAIASLQGIVLDPTQSYTEATDEFMDAWQGRVWAIADAAGGAISVVEK